MPRTPQPAAKKARQVPAKSTKATSTKSAAPAKATAASVAKRPAAAAAGKGGKATPTAAKATPTAAKATPTAAKAAATGVKATAAAKATATPTAARGAAKAAASKSAPAAAKTAVAKQPAAKSAVAKQPAAKGAVAKQPAAKAPQAVKPAPAKPVVLDKFLLEQQALLAAERADYLEKAAELKAEADALALEHEPGDIQFDEEGGEGGTTNVDRELDLVLSAQARAAVDEIDRALAKISAGTYGLCERCGKEIPRPRLKALPYAALCVQCKSGGLSRR